MKTARRSCSPNLAKGSEVSPLPLPALVAGVLGHNVPLPVDIPYRLTAAQDSPQAVHTAQRIHCVKERILGAHPGNLDVAHNVALCFIVKEERHSTTMDLRFVWP